MSLLQVSQEKAEGVSVRGHRGGTDGFLVDQVFAEKPLQRQRQTSGFEFAFQKLPER
jgi:hypothetical protein